MESPSTTDADLRERLHQHEVVVDLSQHAMETDDVDRLLEDASVAVVDTLEIECSAVFERRSGGDVAALRRGVGWQEDLNGDALVSVDPDSLIAQALAAEEPVVVEDFRADDRCAMPELLTDHDVVGGVSAAIKSGVGSWGVLGAYTTQRREFTEHEATFVQRVADVLASAIRSMRERHTLERSEHRYRALVENFPNGAIALVDTDLRYSVVGGTPFDGDVDDTSDLEGKPIREAITDELADVLEPRYRAALEGEASTFECEWDGNHAQIHTFPIRDDDGEVIAAMGMSQDITQRKRAESDLRDSEERFRTMMEQSPFSIQLFDADGNTIAANPAWEQLWDASRDELDDYNVLQDPQLEEAGLLSRIRDAFDGEVVRLPVAYYDPGEIGKPGRDRWIEGYVYPLSRDGDGTFEVAIVHHDVTDRKERERELGRVRERMEFALTATDAVVWDWNVDDDTATFYPSEQPLYGTTVENWKDFIEIIHPDDREQVQRGIEHAIETGEPKYEEIRIIRDGEVRWIEAPGQPVHEEDGSTRMIGVARDVTERKTYERRLKESNERLEQFAHAASHDLQEPLRMVSSYLQLVEKRYADDLDADGREFIEFAVDGADRMREMIDSLLAYSRIETRGKPFEPVALDDVLDAVLTDLAVRIDESDAEIVAEDLPRVEGDPDQLRELLQNLLANAIEYCGDEPPSIEVTARRDGEYSIVSVRDDGIGIDPANHDAVFEVFERLHPRNEHTGMGIGLALSNRIVERHGGDLWVESDPGDGATFSFSLPQGREE